MKTEPAMSNCPIKSGIILEKSVCNDRALPKKLIKTCWCQEQVKTLQEANKSISTCSSSGSHWTRQPRHPAAAALLLSSAWLQT